MEGKSDNKKRVSNWIMAGCFITITSSFYSCTNKSANDTAVEKPINVSAQTLSQSNTGEQLTYSGTIQPDNIVQLGFSVPGRVSEVAVQEGQHVQKGQLLASLEIPDYKNAFIIANAGLEQAQDNFKRSNELHLKGSFTEKEYVAAKIALTQAEANNNLAQRRLSESYLKAPFSGIVTAKFVERGSSALPGAPAFTLMKTDFVYAQCSISESDISKLSIGSKADVIVAAIKDTLHGTVSIINPQGDLQSKTYSVKIKIANSNGRLMPGMISDIKVATGKKVEVLRIPLESVIRDADDLTYVYVIDSDKRAVKKRITVGGLSDSAFIVTSGLKEGETIIARGQKNIQEGQLVTYN